MRKVLLFLFLFYGYFSYSQSFNLEQAGKADLIRLSGGVAVNSIFYEGSANRDPFTYFFNGNMNINISGLFNIPLSFIYSNQRFDVPTPFRFNRLSLHPSYKWVTAHIGDAAMTFSPYTLSGHQFSGFGVDLTPNGPFTISAMYGRFLQASEYDAAFPETLPAYERMGYGLKTTYDFEKVKFGLIFFSAEDEVNSIQNPFPAELNVSPKANRVLSAETSFKLFDKAQFNIEYATSAVTEDTRVSEDDGRSGFLAFLGDENVSTNYYSALNIRLDYPAGNGSIGAGYERVDPGYRTFGAYFFNNDLENITINASQNMFDNKLNVSMNAGLQRDDLNNTKNSKLQRIVTSVNVNYTASEKVTVTGAYSNFQSYTNIRDQFDYINEVSQLDNVDTLNYRQISQNANLGINYFLKKTKEKQHSLNLNMTLQSGQNYQGDFRLQESSTVFYNTAASYTMGYPERALNISVAVNATQNTIAENNSFTVGPTLLVNKQFFDKKLRTGFSTSYNTSFSGGEQQMNIYNIRLNGSYVVAERHNFSLNLLSLLRNSATVSSNDFTATVGYTYAFDGFGINFKKRGKTPTDPTAAPVATGPNVQFRYNNVVYKGRLSEVTQQLYKFKAMAALDRLPLHKKEELDLALKTVEQQTDSRAYRESAIDFLDMLYGYNDFLSKYDAAVYTAIEQLQNTAKQTDIQLESAYVTARMALEEHKKRNDTITPAEFEVKHRQLAGELDAATKNIKVHRWTLQKLGTYKNLSDVKKPDALLSEFKTAQVNEAIKIYERNITNEAMESYVAMQMKTYYHDIAAKEAGLGGVILKYSTPDKH